MMMRIHVTVPAFIISILLCGQEVKGQQLRACRNNSADVYDITFDISYDVNFTALRRGLLFVDIYWTVDNPDGVPLDGFGVHFLDIDSKRDHGNQYNSLEPLETCTSGPNHIFVTTTNQSVCDTGSDAPTCSPPLPDVCFCPSECPLFYPAPCTTTVGLQPLENDFYVTIQPDVRHLSYEMDFGRAYEFSISPYYREFADLAPDTISVSTVELCGNEEIQTNFGDLLQSLCWRVTWAAVDSVEIYVLEILYVLDNGTNIQTNYTSETNKAEFCDLNPCRSYDVHLYGVINGSLVSLSVPVTSVVLLPSTTPTTITPEATTPGGTTPSPIPLVCPRIVCGVNRVCLEVGDGINYECVCKPGFVESGTGVCIEIFGSGGLCDGITCGENAFCVEDNVTSPLCVCLPGFTGDAFEVTGIIVVGDGCSALTTCSNISCGANAFCTEIGGIATCICDTGFIGNGVSCEDIDECSLGFAICLDSSSCVNTPGSFTCDCPFDQTWNGTDCIALTTCSDISCSANGFCLETGGIAACICDTGFIGNGVSCEDIDECSLDIDICLDSSSCENTPGSFTCDCPFDQTWNGTDCIVLPNTTPTTITSEATTPGGTTPSPIPLVCPRIVCGVNQVCLEVGDGINYECICRAGFVCGGISGSGGLCDGITCSENAFCVEDNVTSPLCVCLPGFTGDAFEVTGIIVVGDGCSDVDECVDPFICDENSTCFDIVGSYACVCKTGYSWNGAACLDIDECSLDIDICLDSSSCENTPGSFTCDCPFDQTWNGTDCIDGDTCQSSSCDENADCTDVDGGYICFCKEGFYGDGKFCQDARCPIAEDQVGACVEECSITSDCDSGSICCSNGCGHICVALNCDIQTIFGFQFPRVSPGLTSYSEEKCDGSTVPLASIACAYETPPYFDLGSLIKTNCADTIKSVTSRPFNTSKDVAEQLQSLQVLSADVQDLKDEEVDEITGYFDALSTSDLQYTKTDLDNVAEITSRLTEFYEQQQDEEAPDITSQKQSLVQSVTAISRKYDSASGEPYVVISDSVNIEVQDVPDTVNALTFAPKFYSDDSSDSIVSPILIQIPAEAVQKANELLINQGATTGSQAPSVRVVSVGYRSSSLFPSDRQTDWVIASSLGDASLSLDGISLSDPVVITDNTSKDVQTGSVQLDEFKTNVTYLECVFWDFNKETWSGDGCRLSSENPPTCECNHLTNFAILVSKAEVPSNIAITVVTYVGCGVSAICLICTICVIVFEKRLRRKNPMRVLVNICGCLALSMLLFIFGVDSATNATGCSVITAFLQYFLLATWFWMAVYSHTIYRDAVRALQTRGSTYNIMAAAIVSYGVPFVIVVLNASIALGHIDNNQSRAKSHPLFESSYKARNFCWLRHNSLYFGFLLPVGILLLINLVVFGIVIPKITSRRKEIQSTASKHTFKQHFIIALVMATTLGLSWIIGYLMLISDNAQYLNAMSWIFAIVNSAQGVFIFFFTVVRTGELQKCFRKQVLSDSVKTTSTASTGVSLPRS